MSDKDEDVVWILNARREHGKETITAFSIAFKADKSSWLPSSGFQICSSCHWRRLLGNRKQVLERATNSKMRCALQATIAVTFV